LKLPTVLRFVEFNTTMALAFLPEERDFVGASCGCETVQGVQRKIPTDVTGRGQGRGL
jgi:hypothetical protein